MTYEHVYLGLGSNLGDRFLNIQNAISGIKNFEKTHYICESSIHTTTAVGPSQPDYLNAALAIKTQLTPLHLLSLCQALEKKLGRTNNQRWHARVIDIDILYFGDHKLNFEILKIPHPKACEREFVQVPLREIKQ